MRPDVNVEFVAGKCLVSGGGTPAPGRTTRQVVCPGAIGVGSSLRMIGPEQ